MAPVRYLFFVLAAAGLVLLASGCEQAGPGRNSATEEEPLLLEDAPLLLDDPLASEGPQGPIADNSRCFVCHINYMQEDMPLSTPAGTWDARTATASRMSTSPMNRGPPVTTGRHPTLCIESRISTRSA